MSGTPQPTPTTRRPIRIRVDGLNPGQTPSMTLEFDDGTEEILDGNTPPDVVAGWMHTS